MRMGTINYYQNQSMQGSEILPKVLYMVDLKMVSCIGQSWFSMEGFLLKYITGTYQ